MFGICDLDREYTVWEAKVSNPTRLNHDEQDVKLTMDQHQLNRFDAFKQVRPNLINLTTIDVAPDYLATELLSALVRGKEQIIFHDSINQNRSHTLSSIYEVTLHTTIVEKDFFKDC